jgi:hypothetical protein
MNHFAGALIGSDRNHLHNARNGFNERKVVDALEHKEADRPIGGGQEQHGVHPGSVIGSEERAAMRRNIFLSLQVHAIKGVRGDPQQKADQRIGQKPQ